MTAIADLRTARDALAAELATESANPQPNYVVAGRSFSWSQHRSDLVAQINELNLTIIRMEGAVEIQTIAFG